MGYGTTALVLLFAVSFTLWMFGYTSGAAMLFNSWSSGGGIGSAAAITLMIGGIIGGLTIILATTMSGGALTSNYGVIYTIPLAIMATLAVILLLPLSFLAEPMLPAEVKIFLTGIFGILILITTISFIRGGEF